MNRAKVLLAVTGAVLLALPSTASGADAYVDLDTGTDNAACGPIGQPCQSIAYAVPKAGPGDTIRVDDTAGTYGSPLAAIVLGSAKSLVGEEFAAGDENAEPEPDVILDPVDPITFSNSISVQAGNPAGTIRNLRLRNDYGQPLLLDASATVTGNVFDEPDSPFTPCHLLVRNAGNDAAIGPDNVFIDPTPSATPLDGVCTSAGAAPSIEGNVFTDLNDGVLIQGGDSSISSNSFTGTRGSTTEAAIRILEGGPTISGNLVTAPGSASVAGIWIEQPGASLVGAALRRNTVIGHRIGVAVNDTQGSVTLNGDLIGNSALVGIALNDSGNDDATAMLATNITVSGSAGAELSLNNTTVALNSVILGGPDPGVAVAGDATCGISFSRGPSISGDPNGCGDFSTTSDPGFVSPGTGDFHLAPGSPMIDMGDPAAPTAGILDLDGEARETDGNADGVARRDIGADETAAVPPQPPAGPTPPSQSPVKKCKKKRKKGSASASASGKRKRKCKRKKKR